MTMTELTIEYPKLTLQKTQESRKGGSGSTWRHQQLHADLPMPRNDGHLSVYLTYFAKSPFIQKKCLGMGISADVVEEGTVEFKEAVLANELDYLTLEDAMQHVIANTQMERVLLPSFFKFLRERYPESVQTLEALTSFSDLTSPAEWYPAARAMQRKIIMHLGPTNSGKTYAALRRFEECDTAIYCGPLRLLAHEVYERSNSAGVPCNLLTGEERRESDGVFKWASTVEMAPMQREFDVAVIDEIQMIGDRQRGWAWTNALLGLQAKEIHLCGEATALNLVKQLAKTTGDTIEINNYNRLTPLKLMNDSLDGELKNLKPGDCVVTFSRADIFAMKRAIEGKTKLRAAVIYGSLPPETRSEQAKLFNRPDSDYEVLVASDAIGMGLNLNIRRVVFERLEKFDGRSVTDLSVSQVKQIAGRAGRFRTQYPEGFVTTLDRRDLPFLRRCMTIDAPRVLAAGLHPTLEQVESFGKMLPNETLSGLLTKFEDVARLGGNFFLCNLNSLHEIADLIQPLGLPLRDQFTFVLAPANVREPYVAAAMLRFARAHAMGREARLHEEGMTLPKQIPETMEALREMESYHRAIILYLWLGMRFPETFTDLETASHLKRQCEDLINRGLMNIKWLKRSKKKKQKAAYIGAEGEEMDDVEAAEGIEVGTEGVGVASSDGLDLGIPAPVVVEEGGEAVHRVPAEERY
ncbi:ATP-dependent RNA helicase supv3l1, mitochondrial [Borealophlyctis nickersoniae]|nr:ATP-dependent RNA helicase supv3l1, mitochondrial [Borealophlyctis nickersoniae]